MGPGADALWQTLRDDAVVGAKPTATASPSSAPLTVPPTQVAVDVVNATGVQGLAAQVAGALEVQGFPTPTTGSTADRPNGVAVEYGPGQKEAARTVAAAFEGATLREDAAGDHRRARRLGAGAPAVREVPNRTGSSPLPTPTVSAPSPSPSPTITTRTADQDICS